MKIPLWSCLSLLLLVVACESPVEGRNETGGSDSSTNQESVIASENTISDQGIGKARLGMTLGELKAELGSQAEFVVESSFMVDLDAIAVRQGGETLFYLVYGSWETLGDNDPITMIFTDNPKFSTAEGLAHGMTIQEAEEIYGQATLNYNTDNEMREYVDFANAGLSGVDFPRLSFRAYREEGQFAGIYGEATEDGSYYETNQFHPDATIGMIVLDAGPLEYQDNTSGLMQPETDCADPMGTSARRNCAELAYQERDRELNQTYQELIATLDSSDRKQITNAQLAWLKFRDANCAYAADPEAEIIEPALLNTCLATMTEERTTQLAAAIGPDSILRSTEGVSSSSSLGVVTVDGQEIDCGSPQATPEITYCAGLAYEDIDQELNSVYQQVKGNLSSAGQQKLIKAQQAWIPFRDQHCEFAVREALGGTGYSAYLFACLEGITRSRTNDL